VENEGCEKAETEIGRLIYPQNRTVLEGAEANIQSLSIWEGVVVQEGVGRNNQILVIPNCKRQEHLSGAKTLWAREGREHDQRAGNYGLIRGNRRQCLRVYIFEGQATLKEEGRLEDQTTLGWRDNFRGRGKHSSISVTLMECPEYAPLLGTKYLLWDWAQEGGCSLYFFWRGPVRNVRKLGTLATIDFRVFRDVNK